MGWKKMKYRYIDWKREARYRELAKAADKILRRGTQKHYAKPKQLQLGPKVLDTPGMLFVTWIYPDGRLRTIGRKYVEQRAGMPNMPTNEQQ